MQSLSKWTLINIVLSLLLFACIFYSYAGASGGDMAIVIVNIMTGLLQVITIAVISRINSAKSGQMITGVIVMQAIELLVFSQWGYALNEFIKGLKN